MGKFLHRRWFNFQLRNHLELADYQSEIGWTRGLAVTHEGMFVGTTAIRESNHDYYKIITDSIPKEPAPKFHF